MPRTHPKKRPQPAARLSAAMLCALLAAGAAPDPARAQATVVALQTDEAALPNGIDSETLAAVAGWISRNTALPIPPRLPRIQFVHPKDMAWQFAVHGGGTTGSDQRPGQGVSDAEILAFYDSREQTIFLPHGWTGRGVADMSMLVHEMVHHMYEFAPGVAPSPAGEESFAFALQAQWLADRGETLESALGISPLWAALASPYFY